MFPERFLVFLRFVKSSTAFGLAVLLGIGLWVAFPPTLEIDLSGGRKPPYRFFVLVVSPSYKDGIVLGRYEELPEIRIKEYTFLLPNDSGSFRIPSSTDVSYKVDRLAPDRQNVEVSYANEEGLKVVTRYEARDRAITPLIYREKYWLMGLRYVGIALAAWFGMWILATVGLIFHERAKQRR